jgi:hypothetical protein
MMPKQIPWSDRDGMDSGVKDFASYFWRFVLEKTPMNPYCGYRVFMKFSEDGLLKKIIVDMNP